MMQVLDRIDGVVIGLLIGFADGAPLVVFVGNPRETAIAARSLTELDTSSIGSELALLFEGGDPMRPLVVGRIVDPAHKERKLSVVREGDRVVISGEERIELRCGLASIILEKDGRITIRGNQLTSHASGTNRIRGGAIHLN
ncbi:MULTISPECIES: DUF6484 domain-containing protein [unclassified Mesorhizobium]|uniref:DUF6484 domain-containing protein n=1 Tax=unclassified Mesorhizobium TaxID=325217 RepID=UPI0011264764|nr:MULTISPECIES: DUF6484 domain-containing protein [unclassified Mesorhizobium]MBZ9896166.1 DUF6484 domain-containing protein [Mesorhizobium sp. BR1-1-6]MBZ9920881.1 DUF6484 domain-containing protein [Mesorhizobium sp. BR1-1-7]MBZ9954490.1 DUF6484 domain-containing protein [Mesorhizobium sp. BR1-1-15]MBZ9971545.1 DUF6484 domain-containing protein [Mesorhizobium sp. BR1-1-12]TPI52190.1 hypothetical protein FJW11_18620 [Mesorhizobium sp. B3-1-1]